MMKLNKYLLLALLTVCICPIVMASSQGSSKVQMIFKDRVLELLKQNDLATLKDYIDTIPNCNFSDNTETLNAEEVPVQENNPQEITEEKPVIEEVQGAQICTVDRTTGKGFLWHVWQKGSGRDRLRFDLIEIDAGLFDSLGNLYRFLYHAEPRNFNLEFYKDFYNRFRGTWLQTRVELILTNLWQRGTVYSKWNGFSAMTGKEIYTTLYISYMLGFESMYKYVSPEIMMYRDVHGGGRDRLYTILKEMKQKSEETNSPELLKQIKRSWYYSIAYNEADEEEKAYYQGKKHKKMFELLSEDGWEMFSDILDGVTEENLRRIKHNIALDVNACMRIMQRSDICDTFEQGAIKNGFYTPPIKYVEPTIEEKMQEMQNQINEKLFLYK